jgi:hypothetical protein
VADTKANMRTRVLCVAAAVALVTVELASTALGAPKGPQKATIFGPEVEATGNTCAGGATATAQTFGSVVLDTPGDETTVTGKLTLKRVTPNARFQVAFVERDPERLECRDLLVATISTNKKGNAKFHFAAKRLSAPVPTRFWVTVVEEFVEESPSNELLASSAVELD